VVGRFGAGSGGNVNFHFAFGPTWTRLTASFVFCKAVAIAHRWLGVFCSGQQLFPRLPYRHRGTHRVCVLRRESTAALLVLKRSSSLRLHSRWSLGHCGTAEALPIRIICIPIPELQLWFSSALSQSEPRMTGRAFARHTFDRLPGRGGRGAGTGLGLDRPPAIAGRRRLGHP
jgi:hypothetical protein